MVEKGAIFMSAHDWMITLRRWIANKLYEPFATTAWEPSRTTTALLPAPAQQLTGEIVLPSIIEGIAGEPAWHGPSHTWTAVYLGQKPHRRREADISAPPAQNTSPMNRLVTRLTPIPDAPDEHPMAPCPPFDFDPLQTVMAERNVTPVREVLDLGFSELATWETPEARQRAAIARLDKARANSGALSWLYDDPPVLAPLPEQALSVADRTAVSKTTDRPDSALIELAAIAARFDPDRTEMAIPAVISQRARQLQRWLRESE